MAALLATGGRDEVAFVGVPGSLEDRLAGAEGVRFISVPASGWDRARPLSLLTAAMTAVASLVRCIGVLRRERTQAVVGFGGYVSLPLGLAAVACRVPLVIHEQNSVPGLANRVLARWARAVCVTYADSIAALPVPARAVVTGNPVRASVLTAERSRGRAAFDVSEGGTLLLIFGGSRGARHLNAAMVKLYSRLSLLEGLRVVQIAGPREVDLVREQLTTSAGGEIPAWWTVLDYVEGMGDLLAASDLIVCRAGATTLAELSVLAKASVLVPYPFATDDHQTHNTEPFVHGGAAVAVADASLDGPEFAETVIGLLGDPARRERMAHAAGALGRADAAEAVVAAVHDAVAAEHGSSDRTSEDRREQR